ncbi:MULTISPECIES: nuclear transport factor 2 family protein [Nocardia]|uniref:nuclear transport factor 2 family protein n=1 Tax=Nocardia TaxID=1817 RepID=UPI0007A3DCC4|nr:MULTISPECIES: nuclear transport factor 2 family protein [Nocardia]
MVSSSVRSARQVVEDLFATLPVRDADAFVAALAPDAVFEIPFPIPGMPQRLEGREAIREHLAQRWSGLSGIEVHGVYPTVYESTEDGVLFVENEVDMTLPGAPRARVHTSVNVVHVRDGEVTLFRDYMDTARIGRIAG